MYEINRTKAIELLAEIEKIGSEEYSQETVYDHLRQAFNMPEATKDEISQLLDFIIKSLTAARDNPLLDSQTQNTIALNAQDLRELQRRAAIEERKPATARESSDKIVRTAIQTKIDLAQQERVRQPKAAPVPPPPAAAETKVEVKPQLEFVVAPSREEARKLVEEPVVVPKGPRYFIPVDVKTAKPIDFNQKVEEVKQKAQSAGSPQAFVSAVAPTANVRARKALETLYGAALTQPKAVAQMMFGADSGVGQALGVEFKESPIPVVGGIIAQPQGQVEISDYALIPVQPVATSTTIMAAAHLASTESENPEVQKKTAAWDLAARGLNFTTFEKMRLQALAYGIPPSKLESLKQFLLDKEFFTDELLAMYARLELTRFSGKEIEILFSNESVNSGFQYNTSIAPAHGGLPGFFFRMGRQFFGKSAERTVTASLAKGLTKKLAGTAVGITVKGAFSKITAALGSVIPGLGTLAGYLIGEVITRVGSWIQQQLKKLDIDWKQIVAAAAVAGGLAFGAPVLAIGGGLYLAAPALAAVPSLFLESIAKPLIISMVSIPILIALILFIINSGAYIVPSGAGELPSGYEGFVPSNENAYCSDISGTTYCFPVAPLESTNFACAHHDYPAIDIFANEDKLDNPETKEPPEGHTDDVPLTIVAYIGGTVTWIDSNNSAGGFAFIIRGNDNRYYYYAHNAQNLVSDGEQVETGQPVAIMDSTGDAVRTIEHLHFGISRSEDFKTVRCSRFPVTGCISEVHYEINKRNMINPVGLGGTGDFRDKLDLACPYVKQ